MSLAKEYENMLKIRAEIPKWADYAPYDWIQRSLWPAEYFAYSQMLNEHTVEIANLINSFYRHILTLESWSKVLENKDETSQYDIVLEFVEPIATLALNLPYVIRSRFIYSAAHLCHQANRTKDPDWIDNFPLDSKVYLEEADKQGPKWRSYKKFKLSIERISDKSFAKQTGDFRNAYNHRYSRKIEIGISGFVTRYTEQGKIFYGFGEKQPLKLIDIVPLLKERYALAMKAFDTYKKLVLEQVDTFPEPEDF